MVVVRFIGWVLLAAAAALLGRDLLEAFQTGSLRIAALGEIWFKLNPGSLNALQAGVERYLSVWIWDSVITPILHAWAFVVPLLPGLLLMLPGRRQGAPRKGRHFRR